ncbi:hypothetical protein, partial [Vibrio lentus]|uniref:hypothetical protein n=1 Tax=Vibrio lentus TaxID=136468 RepID=UPI0039B0BB2C
DVTDSNISAMNFSGTTKRFENSAALTLTITPLGSDTPVADASGNRHRDRRSMAKRHDELKRFE